MDDFVECLFCSEFRSSKRTSLDISETELVLFLVYRLLDDLAYNLFDQAGEPYENQRVDQVEEGVEH